MSRGGKREGAGRKHGSVSPRKKALQERAELIANEGVTPLEVMLGAMREAWDKNDKVAAAGFAKDAAPYVHARKAAVEATVDATIDGSLSVSRIELVAPDIGSDEHAAH